MLRCGRSPRRRAAGPARALFRPLALSRASTAAVSPEPGAGEGLRVPGPPGPCAGQRATADRGAVGSRKQGPPRLQLHEPAPGRIPGGNRVPTFPPALRPRFPGKRPGPPRGPEPRPTRVVPASSPSPDPVWNRFLLSPPDQEGGRPCGRRKPPGVPGEVEEERRLAAGLTRICRPGHPRHGRDHQEG